MVEKIGDIQGIFKFENSEYVELDEIKRTTFDLTRHIFYAIDFGEGFQEMTDEEIADSIMIDIIYDGGKKSKYLVRDAQKLNGGVEKGAVESFVTDYPGSVVWLGYFEVPGYAKYSKAGEHTVEVKVAIRNEERDFGEEYGGISGKFTFKMIDDRQPE